MQTITPFIWFDDCAEAAVNFYKSVFVQSKIKRISYYGNSIPDKKGAVMTIEFTLNGQDFIALNGGPVYTLSPAVSFMIHCDTQEEVDHYWERLSAGGEMMPCGWLTDKFGVTWQIVPRPLIRMLADPDTVKAERVTRAMLGMIKLDIAGLKKAYDNS